MLKDDLINSLEKHIFNLLIDISNKYKIDLQELKLMWSKNTSNTTNLSNSSTKQFESKSYDINKIHEYDVKTLKGILKSLNLKVSGKKNDLISRILNENNQKKILPNKPKNVQNPINQKINSQKQQIHFTKINNHYVHEETKLVIDPNDKIIIGKLST